MKWPHGEFGTEGLETAWAEVKSGLGGLEELLCGG